MPRDGHYFDPPAARVRVHLLLRDLRRGSANFLARQHNHKAIVDMREPRWQESAAQRYQASVEAGRSGHAPGRARS